MSDLHPELYYRTLLMSLELGETSSAESFSLRSPLSLLYDLGRSIGEKVAKVIQPHQKSEFLTFEHQNRGRLAAYFKTPLKEVKPILVPIPKNIHGGYTEVTTRILDILLKDYDPHTFLLPIEQANAAVRRLIDHPDDKAHQTLEDLFHKALGVHSDTVDYINESIASIIDKKQPFQMALANTVFSSHKAVENSFEAFRRIDTAYDRALDLRVKFTKLMSDVDTLTTTLTKHPEQVSRDDLIHYSTILHKNAELLSLFGVVLHLLQRVEHAFVETLKKIT